MVYAWDWWYEVVQISEKTVCMKGMWCRERKGGDGKKNW